MRKTKQCRFSARHTPGDTSKDACQSSGDIMPHQQESSQHYSQRIVHAVLS